MSVIAVVDESLAPSVRRVCAALGLSVQEAAPTDLERCWAGTAVLVLDARYPVPGTAELGRRPGVVLVSATTPDLAAWQAAARFGVDRVIELPADEDALVEALARGSGPDPRSAGRCGVCVSGSSGAGASVFAAALASALARERPTVLLDLDAAGPGADVLLGLEDRPGLRWPGLRAEHGRVGADDILAALPRTDEGLAVLAVVPGAEPPPSTVRTVLRALRDAGVDVVVDLPRAPSPTAEAVLTAADLALLVVQATVRASYSGAPVAARVRRDARAAGLVVRGPAPAQVRPQALADSLELPLLAAMRPQRGLDARLDAGGLRLGSRDVLARTAVALALLVRGGVDR